MSRVVPVHSIYMCRTVASVAAVKTPQTGLDPSLVRSFSPVSHRIAIGVVQLAGGAIAAAGGAATFAHATAGTSA